MDEESLPHSHPTLTLHTRHVRDDLLLLSTFIHEQSHWYLVAHQADVDAAVVELHAVAPGLPIGFPQGADTERSSYEHLIVIALEERGLVRLAGELAAAQAMEFWAGDHYRVLYRVVLEKRADIRRVMRAHGLTSPGSRRPLRRQIRISRTRTRTRTRTETGDGRRGRETGDGDGRRETSSSSA